MVIRESLSSDRCVPFVISLWYTDKLTLDYRILLTVEEPSLDPWSAVHHIHANNGPTTRKCSMFLISWAALVLAEYMVLVLVLNPFQRSAWVSGLSSFNPSQPKSLDGHAVSSHLGRDIICNAKPRALPGKGANLGICKTVRIRAVVVGK